MTIKYRIVLQFLSLVFAAVIFVGSAQAITPTLTESPVITPTLVVEPTSPVIPTTEVALPEVPQGVMAVAINHNRIDVSWRKAANAIAYEIYRNNELVAIVESLFYSDDNGLTPETTYSYRVRSFDGSSYSQYSTAVSVTTKPEGESVPEPTIPADPDVSERQPSVNDSGSFVMVGSEKREFDNIGEFQAGEDFVVYGWTVSYADIEVVIKSTEKSFYAKADDKGFWDIKVDTADMNPGMHIFQIIITAENFPEKYESEEYVFEISEPEEVMVEEEANSFGSRVSRTVIVLLVIVIATFAVLVFVAIKKGWLKKLFGKDANPGTDAPTQDPKNPVVPTTGQGSIEQSIGDISSSVIDPVETKPETTPEIPAQAAPAQEPPVAAQTPQQNTVSEVNVDGNAPTTRIIQEETTVDSSFSDDLTAVDPDLTDDPGEIGDGEVIDKPAENQSNFDQEGVAGDEDIPEVELSSSAGSLDGITTPPAVASGDVIAASQGVEPALTPDADQQVTPAATAVPDYSSVTESISPSTDMGADEMVVSADNVPDSSINFENLHPKTVSSPAPSVSPTGNSGATGMPDPTPPAGA